jgi:hypothetical protein
MADEFTAAFKYYKQRAPPPSLEKVFDARRCVFNSLFLVAVRIADEPAGRCHTE